MTGVDEARRVSTRARRSAPWVVAALVASGPLVVLYQLMNSRTFQAFGELVVKVRCDDKYVALTLDDGPTPEGTDPLLELLAQHHAHATFFLVGNDLEKYPEAGAR